MSREIPLGEGETSGEKPEPVDVTAEPRRLTPYELEIMDVIWGLGEATVQEVCDGLSRPLAYTSVMTTMSLLESKKQALVRTKRGRAFVYSPRITREQVSRTMLAEVRDLLFGGSSPSLMLNLISEGGLSADDVSAIRAALDDLEKEP